MTSKQQKKFKKKKEREKEVHKKILSRREVIRNKEREKAEFNNKLRRVNKIKKEIGDHNMWSDDVFLNMNNETLSQLEKNAKILKALEDEYREEHDKKKNLNSQLESEGFKTLDDKLRHLHNKLVNQQKLLYAEAGLNEANCISGKEVSEVEVIKASVVNN